MKKRKDGQRPTYKGIPDDFAAKEQDQDDKTTVAEKKVKRAPMRVKRT